MKKMLSEFEAAELLSISVAKLRRDRWVGTGLPYIRLGRTVRYSVEEISSYLERNTVSHEN